jgi:hypothetical protein
MHLTYRKKDSKVKPVEPAEAGEAGAPEDKIEITDEMIEAGERALLDIGCTDNDPGVCALAAFEAMWKARPKAPGTKTPDT